MKLKGSSYLSVDIVETPQDINILCELASNLEIISHRQKSTNILSGAVLANLFFEPSTRTKVSFATAFNLLGGRVIEISDISSSSIAKGESLADTSRILSGYVDVMVVRHFEEKGFKEISDSAEVPVINAGNGINEHPTQALIDIYTIQSEFTNINNLSICMAGDLKHGRTTHSLAKLLSIYEKIKFFFVSPEDLCMPQSIVSLLKDRGHTVVEQQNLEAIASEVEVLYLTRIQKERFLSEKEFKKYAGSYVVDNNFYNKCFLKKPLIMHPLPRNSLLISSELSYDLNGHPRNKIFFQSDNGIPVRMALFCLILGVEEKVFADMREVRWWYKKTGR